jgi:hypothetical protein
MKLYEKPGHATDVEERLNSTHVRVFARVPGASIFSHYGATHANQSRCKGACHEFDVHP